MKGWILTENGKILYSMSNSIEVFLTKKDLFSAYEGITGNLNDIKRVEVIYNE